MGEAKRRGTFEDRVKTANFTCIICRKSKKASDRSDEHVIPDSLNGYYHIYNVCVICNSKMGKTVDGALLNHKITDLYRFSEKIKGKKGHIPNPFKEIAKIKGNPEIEVRTEISSKGDLITKTLPNKKIEKSEEGNLIVHLSVDASDEKKLEGMRQKFIKRNKLENVDVIESSYIKRIIENPELEGTWVIDTLKFKLGLLKIAYEFAIDSINGYFNDPLAIKISKILEDADYEKIKELKMGTGFDSKIFENLNNILDIEKKRHILILLPVDGSLACFIKIDNLFHLAVQLSNNPFIAFERSVIGINDLETKMFTKKTFIELMNENSGNLYYELEYFIVNNELVIGEKCEPLYPNFNYEVNTKGQPILYKKDGKVHKTSWTSLLLHQDMEMDFTENLYIQTFRLKNDLGLFVKSVRTGKLYEISSFRLNREFSKI